MPLLSEDDLRTLLQMGLLNPTQGSLSDRLRPPYRSPLAGATPMTAPASRLLEQGYNNLPPEYQALLQAAPVRQVPVMEMPEGYQQEGWQGLTTSPQGPMLGMSAPAVGVTEEPITGLWLNPESSAHELVHELGVREGTVQAPWNFARDEALARIVAENPGAVDEQYDAGDLYAAQLLDAAHRARGRALAPQPSYLAPTWTGLSSLLFGREP